MEQKMKTWFTSLNGVITLSAIALVLFLGRTFLDYQFVMPQYASASGSVAMALSSIWSSSAVGCGAC